MPDLTRVIRYLVNEHPLKLHTTLPFHPQGQEEEEEEEGELDNEHYIEIDEEEDHSYAVSEILTAIIFKVTLKS